MTGARERKRAERQKRASLRWSGAPVEAQPAAAAEPQGSDTGHSETFEERMARRYEQRNAEARARLEPLEEGERPRAVTVAAVVSTLLAVAITVQGVLSIAGVEAGDSALHDRRPSCFSRSSSGQWR